MRSKLPRFLAVVLCLFFVQAAFAGSPLKGIDVKLGKNPGGGCANRTTDSSGKADFGLWPKGNYTLSFTPAASASAAKSTQQPPTKLHVSIQGAAGGKIERDMDAGASSQRAVPVQFTLSGSQSLIVVITAP